MNPVTDDHDDAAGRTPLEVPAPTIVGPRPADASAGTMCVPRGMERLLALAGLHGEWRDKTLADPLQAAREAQIPLSGSEVAVLRSIPAPTLRQMIAVFTRDGVAACKRPVLAMGTAAAALLASEMHATAGAPEGSASPGGRPAPSGELHPSRGMRPDLPGAPALSAPLVSTNIPWAASLDEARALAGPSNGVIMLVFPMGTWPSWPVVCFGMVDEWQRVPSYRSSALLSNLCQRGSTKLAAAIRESGVIPLACQTDDDREYAMRWVNLGSEDKVPQVVFLAGAYHVVHHVMDPAGANALSEDALIKEIRAVPALLAAWIDKQRAAAQRPSAEAGRQPETPDGAKQP